MELRYPKIIMIVAITISVILLIIVILKYALKDRYSRGKKIANTHFIKDNNYYKYLKIKLLILKIVSSCFGIASIMLAIYLLARPYKIDKIEEKKYNRDIMLCMDISGSVWNLNAEVIENLKEIVNTLKGDRFGVMVFDNSAVSMVPLTSDYDFVLHKLDSLKDFMTKKSYVLTEEERNNIDLVEIYNILLETKKNKNGTGSSLIGDGLASCTYNFTKLDEERSRVIILSTDNQLSGRPFVTLELAADITKSKNIKVFGLGTSNLSSPSRAMYREAFKNAVEKTDGKLFIQQEVSLKEAIKEIDNVSKSVDIKIQQKDYDIPEKYFIYLLITTSIFIIFSKKVQE